MGAPFDSIDDAIDRSDFASALATAVTAWRARRLKELADLVDLLSARAPAPKTPGRGSEAFHEGWLALAARAKDAAAAERACAVGTLASSVVKSLPLDMGPNWDATFVQRRFGPWLARARALAELGDDPRYSAPLVDLLARVPWRGSDSPELSRDIYHPAVELLVRVADERAIAPLEAIARAPSGPTKAVRLYLAQALPEATAAIAETRSASPELTGEEIAHLDGIVAKLGGTRARAAVDARDAASLLAAIHANPDDDAARAVYADVLLEGGDPRGELIALQLKSSRTPADEKRERALLREHEDAWLGELTHVLNKRVFSRGMLEEAELARTQSAAAKVWERAATDPRLATIRTLLRGGASEANYRAFVFGKAMTGIRAVEIGTKALLADLLASPRRDAIERVVSRLHTDAALLAALGQLPALAALEATPQRRGPIYTPMSDDAVGDLLDDLLAWRERARLKSLALTSDNVHAHTPEALARWLLAAPALAPVPITVVDADASYAASIANGRLDLRIVVGKGKTAEAVLSRVLASKPKLGKLELVADKNVTLSNSLNELVAGAGGTVTRR